jgi:hypothetical protein
MGEGAPAQAPLGGRAFGPGPRWRWAAVAALLAGAVATGLTVLLERGSTAPVATYSQIPSWIPRAKVAVGRVVVASAAHPALAIQGDTVSVRLAAGHVVATAVGPTVPEEGKFPVPATTACTFVLTLTNASGNVPITARAFTILDESGHLHSPTVTAVAGARLPGRARPGRSVTLRIHAILPTGNGQLRWAPDDSAPIVSWDFDVEID